MDFRKIPHYSHTPVLSPPCHGCLEHHHHEHWVPLAVLTAENGFEVVVLTTDSSFGSAFGTAWDEKALECLVRVWVLGMGSSVGFCIGDIQRSVQPKSDSRLQVLA